MVGIPALATAPGPNGGIYSQSDPYIIAFAGPTTPQDALEVEKGTLPHIVSETYIVAQYVPGVHQFTTTFREENPNVALGEKIAQEKAVDWPCLYELGMRESGWDHTIYNKGGSGAFGIPQALPASKLDAYGNRYDPEVQIRWMIDYVNDRYSGACQALQWQIAHNWY